MKQFKKVLEGILAKEGFENMLKDVINKSIANQEMLEEANISGCFWPNGYSYKEYHRMLVMKMNLATAKDNNEIIVVGNKYHKFAVNSNTLKKNNTNVVDWAHNVIKAISNNTPVNENKDEIKERTFGIVLPEIPQQVQDYPMCIQVSYITEALKDVILNIESLHGDLDMEYEGEANPKAPRLLVTLKSTESKMNEVKDSILKHFEDKKNNKNN
ncbi:MAG: hypothetical protein ACRC23_01530 [Aeromonas jandaei]